MCTKQELSEIMHMLPESAPLALAAYRLSKAKDLMQDAKLLYSADQWVSANNCAYYSLFHAMRAVLALRQMDFKKHTAVIWTNIIKLRTFDRSEFGAGNRT